MVCINGEVGRRRLIMGDCCIGEVEEYNYLGITIEGGKHGRSNEESKWTDRNGEICSRAIREQICDWKPMIVSKLMYGCGTLAWYQRECDDLEVIKTCFGRLLWEVGKVWNELVRGESGWSSFVERKVKCFVDWILRIVYEQSLVSDIGRACLMEVGYKSRWGARCNVVVYPLS